MTRRKWVTSGVFILIGLLLVGQVAVGQVAVGQIGVGQKFRPEQFNDAQFVEYEKQLNAILKTRRDEEKEFVKQVVKKVRTARIPAKLVVISYQWARNSRPETKYPFIYFERVLRLQAKKIGLKAEVPPFDYGIYSKSAR